jgi:hypothetical protein
MPHECVDEPLNKRVVILNLQNKNVLPEKTTMDSASAQSFVSIGHDDISLSTRSIQAAILAYRRQLQNVLPEKTTDFVLHQ